MKKMAAAVAVLAITLMIGCTGLQTTENNQLLQAGKVERIGEGVAEIVFDKPFANADYVIAGSIEGIEYGFDGQQEVRFPPKDRTAEGCVVSFKTMSNKSGAIVINWIAVGEVSK